MCVPNTAPTTAPTASSPPTFQSTLSSNEYVVRLAIAIGSTAASDVPWASRCENPSSSTSDGTIRIPPPTPNNPDRNPAISPTSTTRTTRLEAGGASLDGANGVVSMPSVESLTVAPGPSVCRSAGEAGDEVARRLLLEWRRAASAPVVHERAARLESAARGRIDRIGNLAGQHDPAALTLRRRIGDRHAGQQRLGV